MSTDPSFTRGPARRPAPVDETGAIDFTQPMSQPPRTTNEAAERYWRRYGPALLAAYIGRQEVTLPTTIAGWTALAKATKISLDGRAQMDADLDTTTG